MSFHLEFINENRVDCNGFRRLQKFISGGSIPKLQVQVKRFPPVVGRDVPG